MGENEMVIKKNKIHGELETIQDNICTLRNK